MSRRRTIQKILNRVHREGSDLSPRLPFLLRPKHRYQLDIDWCEVSPQNLCWVQTRNYHPRYRAWYQTQDTMLAMEFGYPERGSATIRYGACYWYNHKCGQVHDRMLRLLKLLCGRYGWAQGGYQIFLPDRTMYLIEASQLVRYNWDAYDGERQSVVLWLRNGRAFSFLLNIYQAQGLESYLTAPLEPYTLLQLDFSRRSDWYGKR